MRVVHANQKVLLGVCLLVLTLTFLPFPAWAAGGNLTAKQAEAWAADLEFLAENLPKLHYDAFNSISESEFHAEVELLKTQIPNLSADEVAIGICKLVSLVRDSHTAVNIFRPGIGFYPLQIGYFVGEGPRILAVHPDYPLALLAQPVKVNGVPLAEIETLLDGAFYSENKMSALKKYPQLMIVSSVLNGLNITDGSGKAVWSFRKDGQEFDLTLPVMAMGDISDWATVFTQDSPTPMYRQQRNNPYYYRWNPELKLLYFQYNACVERNDLSFADFSVMLLDAVEDYPFERFIIDLRNNGGGNSGILDPLIDKLAANKKVNQHGVFFVITSRNTYSSAVLNAISLKQKTAAIFVGEPTGGKPNHYGELKNLTLPNSNLSISYSTKYFTWTDDDRDALYPDIEQYVSLENFLAGHDPVLAAILAY